jgi:anhydro-N-acetylmuramic acid kinase
MHDSMQMALGLMSGTSMDGIDAAIIETDGETVARRGPALTLPYPDSLRAALLAVAADPARAEADPLADIERRVTEANAGAAAALLDQAELRPASVSVVGLHGQTVLHQPKRRFTRQLGDGAVLARLLGIDVIAGFRLGDVAAGGQGAPLAPLYHAALARDLAQPLAVLNLGGVANVTYIAGETVLAFDTGPASAMIDDWVRRHTGEPFDAEGKLAAAGRPDEGRLAKLLADPYFRQPPPKSLDRNAFALGTVDGLSLADGAATLAAFAVAAVARAREHLPASPRRWLVTGGGRHNRALMHGLRVALAAEIVPVEAVGWDGDALEAQAFAFLAVRSLRGLPLSLPSTTGVERPMPGGQVFRANRAP